MSSGIPVTDEIQGNLNIRDFSGVGVHGNLLVENNLTVNGSISSGAGGGGTTVNAAITSGRRAQGVTCTSGSHTVTCANASFTSADVGSYLVALNDYPLSSTTGLGISGKITSVTSSSVAVLDTAATSSMSGAASTFAYIGPDQSAAVQTAINAAAAATPAQIGPQDPNEPFGAGQGSVGINFTASGYGVVMLASQVVVPPGARVSSGAMFVNALGAANATTPLFWFKSYAGTDQLTMEAAWGSGLLFGTSSTVEAQCYNTGRIQLWHVGQQGTPGQASSAFGIKLQGYDFTFQDIWIKSGTTLVWHANTGSDFFCSSAFLIGGSTAIYMNNSNQVTYGMIHLDTNSSSAPYGAICIDNGCSDITIGSVQTYNFGYQGNPGSAVILSVGQISAVQNVDIQVSALKANNTGGDVVRLDYAEGVYIKFAANNRPDNFGQTAALVNGVVYGTHLGTDICVVGEDIGAAVTPFTGTPVGALRYTQSGKLTLGGTLAMGSNAITGADTSWVAVGMVAGWVARANYPPPHVKRMAPQGMVWVQITATTNNTVTDGIKIGTFGAGYFNGTVIQTVVAQQYTGSATVNDSLHIEIDTAGNVNLFGITSSSGGIGITVSGFINLVN